ncbi:MAG: hypothetical protein KAJ19_02395 [Gammaproteobacteria bacterium]|nr:hypothetical protein [Gammaproteobacteria bacterium]
MRVIGTLRYTMEAEGTELGGVRGQGNHIIEITSLAIPFKTDIDLAKDDAALVIGLGGITTIKFLSIRAIFVDDTVADADIEFLINDGGGEVGITGTALMLEDTDLTSLKLTNNSNDTTGSNARIFIELAGN